MRTFFVWQHKSILSIELKSINKVWCYLLPRLLSTSNRKVPILSIQYATLGTISEVHCPNDISPSLHPFDYNFSTSDINILPAAFNFIFTFLPTPGFYQAPVQSSVFLRSWTLFPLRLHHQTFIILPPALMDLMYLFFFPKFTGFMKDLKMPGTKILL